MNLPLFLLVPIASLLLFLPASAKPAKERPAPSTVAEKSNFTATGRHADVLDYGRQLAKASPLVRLGEMGTTQEGRKIPLIIVADPPVATPAEAARTGKLVVLMIGNIHAGEVDGKEALLMLARDIATRADRPLLKDLVLVFAPNFNADGGDRLGKHRPWQAGPAEVGVRPNAQGFDLNRDFVKLESPEVRALVHCCRHWDPALVIDTHTTNGSYHGYTITYDGPRHPAAHPALCAFVREQLLPEAGRRLEKQSGHKAYFYGNFSKDRTQWVTYPAQPRYGVQSFGLRNRLGILVESYVYAPYRDRVLATRDFVQACLQCAAEQRDKIRQMLKDADAAGAKATPIALQHRLAPLSQRVSVLGLEGGKTTATGKVRALDLSYLGLTEATVKVDRPYAYLFPASFHTAVENLQRHGIQVEELREDVELDVEVYRIDHITLAKPFQKHSLVSLEATPRLSTRRLPAGTILVRAAQRLGTLATFLLEPQSEDGLSTWNYFDAAIKEGQDFPVLRLVKGAPLTAGAVRPLAEERPAQTTITWELFDQGKAPNLNGNPTFILNWLEDGEHFTQLKEGKLFKVHALTGRTEAYKGSPVTGPGQPPVGHAGSLPRQKLGDAATSPDKKFVAFVRNNNLYVQDVSTKKEQALTTDGGEQILNGKADWVYWEELYHRRTHRAFWWSPDSRHLAFLRFDEMAVPRATVVNYAGVRQVVEITPYPRAGEANPTVKLGIVAATGGPVHWADLSDYAKDSFLIPRVGWLPGGADVYFYIQDRAQTWLDVCTVGTDCDKPQKLFRDTTKAWVEDPGTPSFLKDGSFFLMSERSGWKHLYHFDKSGKLLRAVTTGDWEVRELKRIDESGGWVYFTGTRDNATGLNFYRIKLDGTSLERLTGSKGDHKVLLSPTCSMFVDYVTGDDAPTQVRLYRVGGSMVRTLDTNPVYLREEFRLGEVERVQIPTPDGFLLEASIHKPVNFDPNKQYPVWFMTYGGPHAPTIRDGSGSRVADEAKANLGFIIFRCDPRSASGKGAISTWTAYRQLGIQELKDIETAIRWLTAKPWVDPARVGMSGHSYGGFMTAYMLTHSKLFAAGIAGAPVTDWHNYDTIYTERYMSTPQDNPKGYEVTSVVKAAKNLHGKLLLVHGVMDDNVHVQNTLQLAHALQQANRDFEVMLYPTARHGIFGRHYQRLGIEFMKRTLKPEP
jgi:dipeptidyl aminopeptidase/acylaminoacyl peptidase